MKLLFRFLLIILITAISVDSATSQEDVLRPKGKPGGYEFLKDRNPIILGVEGGLNLNFFSQKAVWEPNYPNTAWNAVKSGFGISPFMSFLVDFPLNSNLGIQLKATADFKYFENSSAGFVTQEAFTAGNIDYRGEHNYDVAGLYLGFSVLFRAYLVDNLVLTVGPVFQLPVGDWNQNWDMIYYDYPNYNVSFKNEKVPMKARVGLEAGLGWRIPLSKKIWLVPQGRFQFMPTVITDNTVSFWDIGSFPYTRYTIDYSDRLLQSIQLSVAVWFGL